MPVTLTLDAAKLRELRLLAGLSQTALAARVGVHPITVSRYERGTANPGPDTIRRLSRVLRVPVPALAGLEDR